MDGLLRKKDLVESIGVAKSTIADWVTEFSVYIPTVKHGAVTYYKPGALDVLNAIRELRENDQSKVQIMELLAKKGFPITVEEAVEDVQRVLSGSDPSRNSLMAVMNAIGQAYAEIGKQTERQNRIESTVFEHSERMADLEHKLKEMQQQLKMAQAEAASARQEAAVAKEQASKRRGLMGKLFGK